MPATRFQPGDIVHALDGGEVGVIAYVRRDGQCCVTWPSGTHEWMSQDRLCGPLANPSPK